MIRFVVNGILYLAVYLGMRRATTLEVKGARKLPGYAERAPRIEGGRYSHSIECACIVLSLYPR